MPHPRFHAPRLTVLLAVPGFAFPGAPARAQDERIREEYLTRDQALALAFPGGETPRPIRRLMTPEEKKAVAGRYGATVDEDGFIVWVGAREGKVTGYAVITEEIGKFHPITFIVAAGPDGAVRDVGIMVYRESRGAEVRQRRFLNQFRGKSLADPIRADRDILKISGATLSAAAVCRGVRKVLAFLQVCYSGKKAEDVLKEVEGSIPTEKSAGAKSEGREAGTADAVRNPNSAIRIPRSIAAGKPCVRRMRLLMGTFCEITAFPPPGVDTEAVDKAVAAAFDEISRLEKILSHYRGDSELTTVNREAAESPVEVSPELFEVLDHSMRWSEKSGGAFDVTVGPLMKAWGFFDGHPRVPADAELEAVRPRIGYRQVRLDPARRSVTLAQKGVELDLGAIGKGYAADRAAGVLRKAGVTSAAVDFSGNLFLLGAPPGEAAGWPVAIADPRDPSRILGVVRLKDRGISTSGDYEKFFEAGGKRYGHLLDPGTLRPVEGMAAVTVVAPTAADADALSTTAFVLGLEKGTSFLSSEPGAEGLLIGPPAAGARGATRETPGWAAMFVPAPKETPPDHPK